MPNEQTYEIMYTSLKTKYDNLKALSENTVKLRDENQKLRNERWLTDQRIARLETENERLTKQIDADLAVDEENGILKRELENWQNLFEGLGVNEDEILAWRDLAKAIVTVTKLSGTDQDDE